MNGLKGLAQSLGKPSGRKQSLTAFSPLLAKMDAGQNAVIFANADSTGYSEYGPFYKFSTALGDFHDYTVVLYRWAEWDGAAATGPKQYAAPVTLRNGSRGTLTVYLAALPGSVAGGMFDGSRRPNAIDAIPTPDLCITHHGHNQQSFPVVGGSGAYAVGAGTLLGPIGMAELKWPGVPQLITSQNPWRDDNGYAKVFEAVKRASLSQPEITLVDTYSKFLNAGKPASLYRDNVHPSDTVGNSAGAQLISDTLVAAYKASRKGNFSTPAWPLLSAPSLIDNGDFANWPGSVPTGWTVAGAGTTVTKDAVNTFGGAAYSAAISPGTGASGQNMYLQKYLSATEMQRIAGKTVTLAALVRGLSTQPRPFVTFSIKDTAGTIRDYALGDVINCRDGWMWLVAAGIPIIADGADAWRYLRLFPSFGVSNPSNANPVNIQRVLITEGLSPKGLIAA
ncbi:MAG: SGNH/GDSL hydrolase family protein [Proteobacteria bacterium]|nr:SGNH/GDSL hydrolase family protein [Pseudomonadota bacterium]